MRGRSWIFGVGLIGILASTHSQQLCASEMSSISPKVRESLFVGQNTPLELPSQEKLNRSQESAQPQRFATYQYADSAELVHINPDVFESGGLSMGSEWVISAFGREVPVKVVATNKEFNGVRSVTGRLLEAPAGHVYLSLVNGELFGYLDMPTEGREWEIIPTEDDVQHLVKDININEKPALECNHSDRPVTSIGDITPSDEQGGDEFKVRSSRHAAQSFSVNTTSRAKLDVLVVYTRNAVESLERIGWDIDAAVSQAFQRANTALANSEIQGQFNLVGARGVDFLESGNGGQMLQQLEDGADGLERAQGLRDETQADIVSLFVHPMTDASGLATLLRYHPEDYPIGDSRSVDEFRAKRALNIISAAQAFNTYTFAHELGHNLGADHHADQINPDGDAGASPGPTDWQIYDSDQGEWVTDTTRQYSAGWRWTLSDDPECCVTVMTYKQGLYFEDGQDKRRVAYFSNPELSFQGAPMGDFLLADNARTLNETFEMMAQSDEVLNLSGTQNGPSLRLQGALSGSWYDTSRSGEGFLLEFAENADGPIATVYWFTYDDGEPYWLFGAAPYRETDDVLRFSLSEASGPSFGADFDSDAVEIDSWGELILTFDSCQVGAAQWQADTGEAGQFDLIRVTERVEGTPCLN